MKSEINATAKKFGRLAIWQKAVFLAIVLGLLWWGYGKFFTQGKTAISYQTDMAKKGTLIVSLSASGSISTVNTAAVTTQASGVVRQIYVTNGQEVVSGTPIAQVDLDLVGQARSSQALASYQGAKNNLDAANTNLYTLQSDLFTNWKKFVDLSKNATYSNGESPNMENRQSAEFISTHDTWLAAEARYKSQQQVIAQTQTSLNSAWLTYQQSSPVIYAPIAGKVTGLSLQTGTVLTSQTNANGNPAAQTIASIVTDSTPSVSINLTEVDVVKVSVGDKVTLTLDAFEGKTFTGKVISIDTVGSVSSGVTAYPAVIKFDTQETGIYPNMTAQANIITQVKDNVLLVPSSAIQTQNGQATVRVIKNGQPSTVAVQTGAASDTETEITSGISEGDTVVIGSSGSAPGGNSQTQSVFSAFGRGGFGGGGNQIRVIR
jgi:RND family efflux transporter MFP subunit